MKAEYLLMALCLLLAGCNNNNKNGGTPQVPPVKDTPVVEPPIVPKDTSLVMASRQVLTLLKDKNYTALAGLFHPVKGIRFSPYGYVDTASDKKWLPDAFLKILKENKSLKWGAYDGSGDAIILTPEAYLAKFVYDADYLHAEKTGINKAVDRGTMIDNAGEIYKGAAFTESFFSGFDKQYNGLDWKSLRLVFEGYQGRLYLVGIIHDQWTV